MTGSLGAAGAEIVVEDYLDGEEASILAFVDNNSITALVSSQDHKRLKDNDQGPNTGGMGAYSPAPIVTDGVWEIVGKRGIATFFARMSQ